MGMRAAVRATAASVYSHRPRNPTYCTQISYSSSNWVSRFAGIEIGSIIFEREVIAARRLFNQTSEPFVKEYRLVENVSSKRESDTDNDNDNDKPICYVRRLKSIRRNGDSTFLTALDGNLSPKYDICHPLPPFDKYISSLGLLMCSSSNGLLCYHINQGSITYLWNPNPNPSTNDHHELKLLPPSPYHRLAVASHWLLITTPCVHIWFDPKSEDYKVLSITFVRDAEVDDDYAVELYSLKTDSWKRIEPCPEFGYCSVSGVCVNGVYYTVATRREEGGYKYHNFILCFDFNTESVCSFPTPPPFCDSGDYDVDIVRLFDCDGVLGVIQLVDDGIRGSGIKLYQLWVLRNNGEWDRVSVYYACGVSNPLAFSSSSSRLFFDSSNGVDLLVFDSADGSLKRLDYCVSPGRGLGIIPF